MISALGLQLLLVAVATGAAVRSALIGLEAVGDRGAEAAAAAVLAGMADEQSGLLAFLNVPSEESSLLVYEQGQEETDTALRSLRDEGGRTAQARQAASVEADARRWERWAETVRLRVEATHQPFSDPSSDAEGRQLFSTFRADQDGLATSLEAGTVSASQAAVVVMAADVGVALAGSIVVAGLLLLTVRRVVRSGLDPLGELAMVAGSVAADVRIPIPHADAPDEVGELAHALQRWQEASSVGTILAEQVPVGIFRIDATGQFLTANHSLEAMLGSGPLVGQRWWTFIHPDDSQAVRDAQEGSARGASQQFDVESRWLRSDGSIVWGALRGAPVLAAEGRAESFVGIVEDITPRKRQAERAALIQRNLLPDEVPQLAGYQLAAVFLPAQELAGDFYDWMGPDEDGRFDLTVADVMGKGVGSALVMATLRTALRATPRDLGAGERVSRLSEAMTGALTDDGLFVTMFHARLDLPSGELRYVDAGHGYCAVRRAGGQMVGLRSDCLPLGVVAGEVYREGRVRLRSGDTLLVFTDGLVEIGDDEVVDLQEIGRALEGARDTSEMTARLVDRVRGRQRDDVTALLLRRA